MLKKMLLLLMAAMLLVVPVSAAEETTDDAAQVVEEIFELTKEQDVLLSLELITTNSYGTLDVSANVTREDFVGVIGTLLQVDPTYSAPTSFYFDVEPDTWSTHTINELVELGALTVPADKQFRPKDNITLNEAIKVFTCILGYGEVAAQGGFPSGYQKIAQQIDLLDGISKSDKYLTNGNLYKMLYNALHIDMLRVQGVVTDYIEYSNEEKQTLLSQYHDIYFMEGAVETIDGISLTSASVPAGYSIISGVKFINGDVAAEQYLGYNVTAYYKMESNKRELLYLDASENVSVTIKSDELAATPYSGGYVYYCDANEKERKLAIDSAATIIYNGETIYSNIADAFDVKYGEIRMVDRGDDGAYDVVYIEDGTVVFAKSVKHDTGAVVDGLRNSALLDLSSDAKDKVLYYNEIGESATITAINNKSVLNVATSRSGKNGVVRISNTKISGTVDSIQSTDNVMFIDGTEYTYLPEAKTACTIGVGKSGTFYLDYYGNVAYFEEEAVSGEAAVVVDVAAGVGMDATIQLKLLNTDGNIEVKKLATNARIDGKTSKTYTDLKSYLAPKNEDLFTTINDATEFTYELILYRTNKDGDISYIDTKTYNSDLEDPTSLRLLDVKEQAIGGDTTKQGFARNDDRVYTDLKKFGYRYDFDADVVLFSTPMAKGLDDKSYTTTTLAALTDGGFYNALIYSTDGVNDIEYAVFYAEASPVMTLEDYFYWAANVYNAVTPEGEPYILVEAWHRGGLVNVMFRAETPDYAIPKRLDVFRYKADLEGYVTGVEIHYDYATNGNNTYADKLSGTWAYSNNAYNMKYNWHWNWNYPVEALGFRIFHPVRVDGNRVEWGYDSYNLASIANTNIDVKERDWRGFRSSEDYMNVFEVTNLTDKAIIVYDAETDKFRVGSHADLMPAETYGREGASQVIMQHKWGSIIQMFIINNRHKVDGYPDVPSSDWGQPF